MGHQRRWIQDGELQFKYYPSPVSRKAPDWLIWLTIGFASNKKESELGGFLTEIYQAADGGQNRLAALGRHYH
jgi:hypothetical protein